MTLVLRKHQKDLVQFCFERKRSLAWHEVGLGKTLSSINAARRVLATLKNKGVNAPKALVIVPAYLIPQWRMEIAKYAIDMTQHLIITSYSQLLNAGHLIKYYDFRMLILDESHYIKTLGTQRIRALRDVLTTLASSRGKFEHGHIMLMTATPVPNHAGELYTTWALCSSANIEENIERLCDRKRYMDWIASFSDRALKKFKKGGKTRMGYDNPTGVVNENHLMRIIEPFTHFRAASDCLDLPPLREMTLDLGMKDDELLKEADISKPMEYMALVERLNQAKAPHAYKWVRDFCDNNPHKHLIVFSTHKKALHFLKEKLGKKAELITGDLSPTQRQGNIEKFRTLDCHVLLVTYGAGALGLNLQFAHNTLYIGYPWSPKIITQAMGRTNRSGQENKTVHTFLLSGENDRRVLANLRNKEAGIDNLEHSVKNNDRSYPKKEIELIIDELI